MRVGSIVFWERDTNISFNKLSVSSLMVTNEIISVLREKILRFGY